MASSKKLLPGDLAGHVENKLKQWHVSGRHVVLALSGGADSVALLDILAPLRASLHFTLSALHVNHRISPHAGRWAEFCARLCAGLDVPFTVVEVDIAHQPGESLEASARAARYRALAAHPADFVVLAQHLDDQAETLLLQLLRGAGAKGLSAMGELGTRHSALGTIFLRPLLDVPRRTILDHAALRGLKWVDDESNADTAFDRNYLRHRVLPLLAERFPGYRETFARTSRNLAESALLMDDLARLDGAAALAGDRLKVDALRGLSEARAKNLLRYWLAETGVVMPSSGRLENILQQLRSSRDDAQIAVSQAGIVIRRYRGEAHIEKKRAEPQSDWALSWSRQDRLDLPEFGGQLSFEPAIGQGLSLFRLTAAPVTVKPRRGGERLRPDCRRPSRSLKNLLQEAGMPPWQRQRLPLLFSGEKLVFVPGIGMACEYLAGEGEEGVVVEFRTAV
ncbi:MAG: tRNA lysidine(34) synthetase TilS [Sulfuricella sp.]|nr:tRNA lysidine(34) synthetase TilS [Sulfuricella sp.]